MNKISTLVLALAFIGVLLGYSAERNSITMNSSKQSIVIESLFSGNLALVDIPGIEIAIIPNFQSDNSFQEYYVFQYDQNDTNFFDVTAVKEASLVEATTTHVKLLVNSTIVVFTMNEKYVKKPGEIVFRGYGLAHKKSNNYLLVDNIPAIDLSQVIEYNNQTSSSALTCTSGGAGAQSCTAGAVTIGGGGSCSVSCGAGYYACCDNSVNKCKCIKESGGSSTQKPALYIAYKPTY